MTQLEITDIDTENHTEDNSDGWQYICLVERPVVSELGDPIREALAVASVVSDSDGLEASDRARFAREAMSGVYGDADSTSRAQVTGGVVSWSCSESGMNVDGAVETAARKRVPHLIVDDFTVLGDSPGLIADRVKNAVDADVTVHIVSQGIEIGRENVDTVLKVLNGLDETGLELQRRADIRDIRGWLPETDRAGRPPLGFEKDDGELVPSPQMDEVRAVLSMRVNENISQRRAAKRLGVSPRTINRAMDNLDRYGVEDSADK